MGLARGQGLGGKHINSLLWARALCWMERSVRAGAADHFTFVWRCCLLMLRFRIPGCVEMPEALALGRGDHRCCVASMGGGPTLVFWGWLWSGRTAWGSFSEACYGPHAVTACLPCAASGPKPWRPRCEPASGGLAGRRVMLLEPEAWVRLRGCHTHHLGCLPVPGPWPHPLLPGAIPAGSRGAEGPT